MQFPKLKGSIRIDEEGTIIRISGDPEGLRSLAGLLVWLADADQDEWPYLPEGQAAHLHIYPRVDITSDSREVEISRLDGKGTGKR